MHTCCLVASGVEAFQLCEAGVLMNSEIPFGRVVSVSVSGTHTFSKDVQQSIRLLAGLGVEGDAHLGTTVKHRSRVAKDPTKPNLRQVHLLHEELLEELNTAGFRLYPGAIGENILTRGVDLLRLPQGAQLHIGNAAIVEVTGLRDPCKQLNQFRSGLMAAVLDRDAHGNLIRKAGIMGIVRVGGDIKPNDEIRVELPAGERRALERV
jgi:MOSC domain-containing protein YiiM